MTPSPCFAGLLTIPPGCADGDGQLDARGGAWVHEGRLSLAVHGDVVNRRAVAAQLGLPADTPLPALLLAGWRRWERKLSSRLDGVYALAVRDGIGLWLYRDPSGLQNLFCHVRGDRVAFASDLQALRALPGVDSAISHRALHGYLRFLEVSPPQCILEGTQALMAGEWQAWNAAAGAPAASVPAGAASVAAQPDGTASDDFEQVLDELDQRLQTAVAQALDGADRPALLLSGGVDSALLASIASRLRPGLTAYTVGFDSAPFDEAPTAARIAQHLGVRHQVLRFGDADYRAALPRVARQLEQPMADPATLATVLTLERLRERHGLVIDGTGADEIVGLMPARHVRVAVAWGARIPLPWRRRLVPWMRRSRWLAGQVPLLDFEHPAETMMRWNGFRRAEIERLCGEPVSFDGSPFLRTFDAFARSAHFERYSALMNVLTNERLNQAARISGLPLRYPFWNPAVTALMRQIRIDFRYLPGQPKRILRALLARYVPRALWDTPKHGFDFPLQAFLAANDHALVRHHLDARRWRSIGLLSPDEVGALARRYIGGERVLMFRIWALVVLSAWLAPDMAQA